MKDAETKKYKEYKDQLAVVRLMSADRRTIQEIMKGVKSKYPNEIINTENDFFDWLKTRNSYVQNYLKEYAKELNKAGKKNEEIAEKIGRSVGYVALLLNSKRQSDMNTGKSSSSVKDETIKQKAIRLAEQDTPLVDISVKLGVTTANLKNNILGQNYCKLWAKRLADNNNKVSSIASKLNRSEKDVYETLLGENYIKQWIKRLANANLSVGTIASYIGNKKTSSDVVQLINAFDSGYMKSWALRRVNGNSTYIKICNDLNLTTTEFHNLIGKNNIYAWAKRLADANTEIEKLAHTIGYTAAYTRSSILGKDYMKSWVVRLSKQKKTVSYIAKLTKLQEKTVKAYIEDASAISNSMKSVKKSIQDATKTMTDISSKKIKQLVSDLVFDKGYSMSDIINNKEVKACYGGKSPDAKTIRNVVKDDFLRRWIKRLAGGTYDKEKKAIEGIAKELGYSTDSTGTKTIRGYLGVDYLSDWAKRTVENDFLGIKVSDIIIKLSVPNAKEEDRIKAVHNYLKANDKDFLIRWAKRLADSNKHISTIASTLGVTSEDVRTYLGNTYIVSYIKRVIKNVPSISDSPQKDVKWITETKFGLPYDEKNKDWLHNKLLLTYTDSEGKKKTKPSTAYKNWAENLKNSGRTVSQIAKYTGRTNAYVRDTLLGNDIMKAWVIKIVRGTNKTCKDVNTETGLDAVSAAKKMGVSEFRSWAIRLTESDKNYKASQILQMLGTIRYKNGDKLEWKELTTTECTSNKNKERLCTLLQYRYVVRWVKRLSKERLTDQNISTYTGLDLNTIAKYKKAKSIID